MLKLAGLHDRAKQLYDEGVDAWGAIGDVGAYAIGKLASEATAEKLAVLEAKRYSVFRTSGRQTSRPFLPALFENDRKAFLAAWGALGRAADPARRRYILSSADIDRCLYSAITGFSICYDLWKPQSRKTPGTFFEVLIGSAVHRAVPHARREKFIPIPDSDQSVSSDIVLLNPSRKGGLVIAAKITTRERVVQPFAHQRILDSVFGSNSFSSVLCCVSEMQREGDQNANAICVPGTIRLFQCHLAKLAGLYYLDPPQRYLSKDVTAVVPVGTIGHFLTKELAGIPNI